MIPVPVAAAKWAAALPSKLTGAAHEGGGAAIEAVVESSRRSALAIWASLPAALPSGRAAEAVAEEKRVRGQARAVARMVEKEWKKVVFVSIESHSQASGFETVVLT